MIKNFIFDFGNVIAKFDPYMLTAPYVEGEQTRKLISEVAFDRLYWSRLDDGTITDEEVLFEIKKRLPDHLSGVGCEVYNNWINNLTLIDGIDKLIVDIKKSGKKLYLLSNISVGFAENYKNVKWIKNILDMFDGFVFSGPINLIKPSKEIFDHLVVKYNISKKESIFIDDSILNINGANDAGIKGYLFDGNVQKLREYLGF